MSARLTITSKGFGEYARMALELAALVAAVRRYVAAEQHLRNCRCVLCEALAEVDRPKT
jgi:hypothetical protein